MSDKLAARVRGMISRAVVSLVNDALKMQGLQVTLMADQTPDDAEHFQHYGFTSVPLPGAEGIALAVGGSTGHTVVINVDDRRYRIKPMQGGEVCLYDDQGQKVHLTRTGIVIDGAGKPIVVQNTPTVTVNASASVTINAPDTFCTGKLTVTGLLTYQAGLAGTGAGQTSNIAGNIVVQGNATVHGTATFNNGMAINNMTVTHNGVSIGATHKHGGVTAGGAQTAVPV